MVFKAYVRLHCVENLQQFHLVAYKLQSTGFHLVFGASIARKRSPFPLMFCSVRRRKVRKICLTFRATCVFHSVEFDFSLPLNLAATVSLKLVFIHSKTSKTLISSALVHAPRLLTAVTIFFRPFSPQRTLSSSSLF